MSAPLALALAVAVSSLAAQDKSAAAAAAELPQLRAAFAAAKACDHAAVIAVVPGSEPVILTAGSDASGEELTPQTLVPLLALAKVLAADAIYVQRKEQIDTGSGEKLGDRELTVRELLDGLSSLPNFYVLDGGDDPVDAALLRQCGAMAEGAKMELGGAGLGAPEFVLLEPLAFGERYKDWPSMLRSTLAPRVSGLDPVSADALAEPARSRTILTAEDLAKLATARPAVLRTMLSLQNLGAWLQWRSQREVPLWTSARMGRMMPAITRPGEQRLVTGSMAFGVSMTLSQYPTRKAALLWIGPDGATVLRSLQRAFEEDVYPAGGEAAQGDSLQARMRAAAAARPDLSAFPALQGTRWCSVADGGKKTARLTFGGSDKEPLTLTLDGEVLAFYAITHQGEGLRAASIRRANVMFTLWLRPETEGEKPTKLACVLTASRSTGTASGSRAAAGAAVPQYFELVPEKD